jgi:hypothetical protein
MDILKNKWKMMNIIKDAIIQNNGFVFGGFVRDSIIHDHFARLYYDNMKIHVNNDYDTYRDGYSDPEWMIDTIDRLIVPNDIDCFLYEKDYNVFINTLHTQRLTCKPIFNRNASEYIKGFEKHRDDSLRHRRLKIMPDLTYVYEELRKLPFKFELNALMDELKELAPLPIQVDIITSKQQYDEPFMTDLDFECNSLYISKHGLSTAFELVEGPGEYAKFKQLTKVIDDIIKRVAVYCHPRDTANIGARVQKLMKSGWKIKDNQGCIETVCDEDYEGHCIICHEDVPNIHFKMTCCDARYHDECMKKTLECSEQHNHCVMCKTLLPFSSTHTRMFE